MNESIVEQIKRARKRAVPLVQAITPDQIAAVEAIITGLNGKGKTSPFIMWDSCMGFTGLNDFGNYALIHTYLGPERAVQANKSEGAFNNAMNELLADPGYLGSVNPTEALIKALQFPENTVIFAMNMFRVLAKDVQGSNSVAQGILNLRNPYKKPVRLWTFSSNSESATRMFIMLTPVSEPLPEELRQDVMVIEEDYPDDAQRRETILAILKGAGLDTKAAPKIIEQAVDATRAMAAFCVEQETSLSLLKNEPYIDIERLEQRAIRIIDQQPGLGIFQGNESFASIAGYANMKFYISNLVKQSPPGVVVFVDEFEKGMAGSGGGDLSGTSQGIHGEWLKWTEDKNAFCILLVGVPGCLAGDTQLSYLRGNRPSGRPITLEDLYYKFNGIPCSTRPWVDLSTPTYLQSVDSDGVVFFNRVVRVVDSGIKQVIKITFDDGSHLILTPDHPVAIPGLSFVDAGNLKIGDSVLAKGSMLPKALGKKRVEQPRVIVNLKYHPYGAYKETSGYEYTRVARARLIVEAEMNDIPYEEFIQVLKLDEETSKTLQFLPHDVEVHHRDENTLNDERTNLEIMTKAEHARLHGRLENFHVDYVKELCITHIVNVGNTRTFDIQMDDPARNFCANGVFVHNCGKSLFAKATGNLALVKTIKFELQAMKGSLVGQTTANIRNGFKTVDAFTGTKYPLVLATSNNVRDISAEAMSRFALIFFFDIPTDEETEGIWPIQTAAFGVTDKKIPDVQEWTGREIRNCVRNAKMLGITLEEASTFISPTAKSAAKRIAELRTEATERGYISSSYKGPYKAGSSMKPVSQPKGKSVSRQIDLGDS